ncbi:FAD-dependent oxidoreductase, partial [Bacillus sp. JJ1764]|uniref:FAD-dependent oxidoreductase n=1 Tax=Bacillus sp. JJ1764 TaxID=3122964 RepID=UPI002FFD8A97
SIEFKGKTYEMGAIMGLPSYQNTKEVMEELNLLEGGPLLERKFFNSSGRRIPQIPIDQIEKFTKEFKRLPDILESYSHLKEPGFLHLPLELCQPFTTWCVEHELFVVEQIFRHYFTTFGFGNISEVPAAYVLKFLTYENLISFIEITYLITWPKGVEKLVQRMAEQIDDVRLTCAVTQIEKRKDGKLRVHTDHGGFEFDKVIYTSPLHSLSRMMQLGKEEEELIGEIQYEHFRVYAYQMDNFPKLSGYIPSNMYPDRKGHMMAWFYRWGDEGATDLVTVYVLENEEMTNEQMRETIECELRNLGGENIRLYMMKRWEHFPHVNSTALRQGFYEKLEHRQGRNGLYLAGEIMNFSTIENCITYAKFLVDRYF